MACRATHTYRAATATGVVRGATATVIEIRCIDTAPWALADQDGYYILANGDLIDVGVPA